MNAPDPEGPPVPTTMPVVERNLGRILLTLLFGSCLLMLLPFLTALLWAAILSYSLWPVYQFLLRHVGGRRNLAALLCSLGLALVVLLPFAGAGAKVAGNVDGFRATARQWAAHGLPPPPVWLRPIPLLGPRLADAWQEMVSDRDKVEATAQRLIEPVSRLLLKAGLVVGSGLVHLALSILVTFFLLREGTRAAAAMTTLLDRIGGERGRRLLGAAGDTMRGVVYGILGTALLQAVLAGAGFLVAGVPGVGLLVLVIFVLSVVPMGPPLVFIPAALWLFAQGSTGWGVFMLVWGLAVSSLDNVVRPWLISQGSDLPFLLIFLGVVGGALTFGFIGVFLGPTLFAVAHRLVQEWAAAETPRVPPDPAATVTASSR